MARQKMHISIEAPDRGLKRVEEAWHRAEAGKLAEAEVHLNYEDLAMLMALLTPRRLELLKTLRRQGPLRVSSLAKQLGRDYKDVHVDTRALEDAGLLTRIETGQLEAPWDVIDEHFSFVM